MANSSVAKIDLGALDDLFKPNNIAVLQNKPDSIEVPLAEIDSFPNHPFKVVNDEAMLELVKSIQENGLITPAIVRKKEDGRYELISGHRRKMACELAGFTSMAVIVRDLDKEAATITMVDSNMQREQILPSEKAYAYKMRLDAMKKQGKRTDLTSTPMGQKLENKYSVEVLSEKVGESRNQIQRYIRLTELVPNLLQMVDDKTFGFQPAVEISYLKEQEQSNLLETIESEERTPSLAQAQRMKQLSADGRLSMDVIFTIMTEEKPNEKQKLILKDERFNKYFPKSYTIQQKEDLLARLLENWWQKQKQQER
jgi:ParB family transcriptional regulator, chromosome partitioning protein